MRDGDGILDGREQFSIRESGDRAGHAIARAMSRDDGTLSASATQECQRARIIANAGRGFLRADGLETRDACQ